jgi:iron complex transport system substrate-binding protein
MFKRPSSLLFLTPLLLANLLCATASANAATDMWKRMPLPSKPQRVLSLSPATTEMLFALQAESKVVAVTDDCNYPAAAKKKPSVGRFGNILLEKIAKTRPDLIVTTADMQSRLTPLKALSIPVLALQTRHLQDLMDNTELLGKLTQHTPRAKQLIHQWKTNLPAPLAHPPTSFYMVWHDPLMAASDQSFIGDLILKGGGKNVVHASAPFLRYRLESLLKADPQLLILPKSLARQLDLSRPPYSRLKAVKQKHVLVMEDDIISRPGPRSFDALRQIHGYIKATF